MTKDERIKYGLFGAALGGSIAWSVLFFSLDRMNWPIVVVAAAACGALASCFGERVSEQVVDFLKDAWWWS